MTPVYDTSSQGLAAARPRRLAALPWRGDGLAHARLMPRQDRPGRPKSARAANCVPSRGVRDYSSLGDPDLAKEGPRLPLRTGSGRRDVRGARPAR
jgi:hypothetical protein